MNKLLEKRCLIWNRRGSSLAVGQQLTVLLFDALFTSSPSDNCSDKEHFAAMSGLHESLSWTSGDSWLNCAPSCFSSWTPFMPVKVLAVEVIFFCIQIRISWTCSWAYLCWTGSYHLHISGPILWTHQHVLLCSKTLPCSWKSTSCYSTYYYISHLNYWHITFPICFSVPFSSFSLNCTLHSVYWLLYWIHLNQPLCCFLENSCGTMQEECWWSWCHSWIPHLSSFWASRVNLCTTMLFSPSVFDLCTA